MDTKRVDTGIRADFLRLCILALALSLASPVAAAPGDTVLKRKADGSSGFPAATFPHWIHRINYRCDACHTQLFEMEAGKAEITMADINAGRACGTCHNGERAFAASFSNCNRCHAPVGKE